VILSALEIRPPVTQATERSFSRPNELGQVDLKVRLVTAFLWLRHYLAIEWKMQTILLLFLF
jgi:hypothetical protein